MVLNLVFDFFSNYLIEFMAVMLFTGLIFRWASWHASRKQDAYFSTFTGEIEKVLANRKASDSEVEDVEVYLSQLLEEVQGKLPTRSIRNRKKSESQKTNQMAKRMGAQSVVSLNDYIHGDKSFFHFIKAESASFKSQFPPNYNELTERILEKDNDWNKLLGILPIGPIARLNDNLPGLFVVFGIFGTFIGISLALPEIAKIDFNNLDASGEILTRFVLSVTYAMKTSIAGILFSLVMTFLNTLAPVRGLRVKTFKKVSTCFETIWHNLHGDTSAEAAIAKTMPELLAEVKQLREIVEKSSESQTEQAKKSA